MPQPNYNQGTEYWCSEKMIDLDYDNDSCFDNPTVRKCRQCYAFEKQDYTLVVQREDQKHLISPERK
jgi:hypothetical protein